MHGDTMPENSKTQDVLHFTPIPLKIIDSPQAIRLLEDPHYYIIIEILRKRSMTIREIEEAYKLKATDHDIVESKSYNTIYRYLKALENAGLVIPAGKRVEFGKTASETLFSRTAKLFHYGYLPDCSKDGLDFINRTLEGLMLVYGGNQKTETCLRKVIREISEALSGEIARLAEKNGDGKLDDLLSGEWEKVVKAIDFIAFFGIILNHPELVEKLQNCV
ncbi:MAG: winged helix-turn-helix domain-containing protein [Candidatus Odinarchaeota archaeon]